MEKQRIDYLDAAKSLAVLFVALGLALKQGIAAAVLASVTLPLLFFTSGVFISRHRHSYNVAYFRDFLLHNIETLVCPYVVFALLYGSLTLETVGKIAYASEASLSSVSIVPMLWYIPCLFVSKLFMELFLMASSKFEKLDRRIVSAIASGISFSIGFLLPKLSFGYPWSVNVAFVALGFMLIGYTVKDYLSDIVSRSAVISFAVMLLCGGFFALTFLAEGEVAVPDLGNCEVGQAFLYLLRAFMGIFCLLALSMLITSLIGALKLRFVQSSLTWLSRNILRVYLLLPLSNQIVLDAADNTPAGWEIPLALVSFVLTILIAVAIGKLFPKQINVPQNPEKT